MRLILSIIFKMNKKVKKIAPGKIVFPKSIMILVLIVSGFCLVTAIGLVISGQISVSKKPDVQVPVVKDFQSNNEDTGSVLPQEVRKPSPPVITVPLNSGKSLQIPILTYHYIGNNPKPEDTARDALSVPPDKFDNQIGILVKNGYSFISLDTMYAALKGTVSLPPKPVILTFDDGYIDFYLNAFPILRKYNAHAVVFIPTGLIGTTYYMSWPQIKEIDATGLISFQAHSVHHKNLTSIPQSDLITELVQSKKDLENNLGKPVNFMAYPEGASNGFVWDQVQKAGYLGAVGTYYGTIVSEGNLLNMPRIKVSGSWSDEEFSAKFE